MINIIAAIDDSNGIGKNGMIPWKLPCDLKRFKMITDNGIVIMGRVTWESLPRKPLPNRINIIVTRSKSYLCNEDALVAHSFEEALAISKSYNKNIFVIGGEQLYKHALEFNHRIYLTHVFGDFNCDRHFPHLLRQYTITEDPLRTYKTYNYQYLLLE
jgi:dihydrofolate reductase